MPTDRGQSSEKLVYLRDHTLRPRSRASRVDRRPPALPPADLAAEATWLGRSLFALAGFVLLYWTILASGIGRPEGDEAWRWTISHSLPHLFLAAASAIAARFLLRGDPRAPLIVGLVAGALIVLALEGIARAAVGGSLDDLSLSARTDVLTRAVTLAMGVWAASFALRAERRLGGA